jgi:hypothetical protein
MKKIFTIIIIFLLFISVGFFAASFFFNGNENEPIAPPDTPLFGEAPQAEDRRGFSISDFFGFSDSESGDIAGGENGASLGIADDRDTPRTMPRLRQLTVSSVGGVTIISRGSNSQVNGTGTPKVGSGAITVLYTERQTGHIYAIDIEKGQKERISNTTIPGIRETAWSSDGVSAVLRYIDDADIVKTFFGILSVNDANISEGAFDGVYLSDEIQEIVVSPGGSSFFSLMPFGVRSVGTIIDFDTGDRREVFGSPFTEWRASWPHDTTIALTSAASYDTEGVLHFLNTQSEITENVLNGVRGLTTLVSPTRTHVLYSESVRGSFVTKLFNRSFNTTTSFPVITLPEKCTWSKKNASVLYCGVPLQIPNADYPDAWYKGDLFFTDSLWKINIETGSLEALTSGTPREGESIDLTNPKLSKDEKYIIFTNKRDGTLWSLELE